MLEYQEEDLISNLDIDGDLNEDPQNLDQENNLILLPQL